MHTPLTPFEQFAQNASGTSGLAAAYPYASSGIQLQGGLGETGAGTEALKAYGLTVVGAAGISMAIGQFVARRPGRFGPAVTGGMVGGGLSAMIAGTFGIGLSNTGRLGLGAAGLGLLAGAYFTSKR